jgi:hypothetical protein
MKSFTGSPQENRSGDAFPSERSERGSGGLNLVTWSSNSRNYRDTTNEETVIRTQD